MEGNTVRHYAVNLPPAQLAAAVFHGDGRDAGNGYLDLTGRILAGAITGTGADWRTVAAGVELMTDRDRVAAGAIVRQNGQDYLLGHDGNLHPVIEIDNPE